MNSENSKNKVQAYDGEDAAVVEAEQAAPTHDKVQAYDQAYDGEDAAVVEAEQAAPTHDKVQAYDQAYDGEDAAVEEEK